MHTLQYALLTGSGCAQASKSYALAPSTPTSARCTRTGRLSGPAARPRCCALWLIAHICDIGMKPHTPMHVLQNLETKRKIMLTKFPDFKNQAPKRFPSLSCILAKMNEDDIGVHNEYLKYKTTFFRLAFTF